MEDAPKTIEDIVNPKYKGMLVMADPTLHVTMLQWLSSLHKMMAEEKVAKFIRDLGDETDVGRIHAAGLREGRNRRNPHRAHFREICLQRGAKRRASRVCKTRENAGRHSLCRTGQKAPHPNAGKAFVDFYLDDEAMKILAQSGEFVNRKGIYPPLPGTTKSNTCRWKCSKRKISRTTKRNSGRFFCAKDATSEREPSDSVRSLGALYQDLA